LKQEVLNSKKGQSRIPEVKRPNPGVPRRVITLLPKEREPKIIFKFGFGLSFMVKYEEYHISNYYI